MKEKPIGSLAGIPIILAVGAAFAGMAWYLLSAISAASITAAGFIAALAVVVVGIFFFAGLYTLEPNQAAVLSLFGKYVGTVKPTQACAGTAPSMQRSGSASACEISKAAGSRSMNSTAARSRSRP